MNSFQPYKSPGPDGIAPIMLQQSIERTWQWLAAILEASFRLGHISIKWRKVNVVFIPKAGKMCHNTAKDFRPISLSSFMLKTAERLIDYEVRSHLNMDLLASTQHAYWKGRSTETALHSVVSAIEDTLEKKEFALAAFLDIEGAFNNVTTEAIMNALRTQGVSMGISRWIECMLSTRIVKSELGNQSLLRTTTRGTPQGGVISPLLWLLVVNDILVDLASKRIKTVAYADDVVVIVIGKFLDTLVDILESVLRHIKNWTSTKGLNVNAAKTEIVLFTRKYKIPAFRNPRVGGVDIPITDKAKYLGIILDRKLSWHPNLEERKKKALIAWHTTKKCIGKTWGFKPSVTLWIYTAIVRPILSYGSLVWWKSVEVGTSKKKLDSLQRTACIGITGALRTTPTAALEVMINLIPLDLFIVSTAAQSASRLNNLGRFRVSEIGHRNILSFYEGSRIDTHTDQIQSEMRFESLYETVIPTRDEWTNNTVIPQNEISVYTDGSKMDIGTGSGIHCESLQIEKSIRLSNICTVFQAEMLAIKKAAEELLLNSNCRDKPISIYVDSQAAIKALGNVESRTRITKETKSALNQLALRNGVRICWVPGHEGFQGNEKADANARSGSEQSEEDATSEVLPPLSYTKGLIRNLSNDVWMSRWSNIDTCSISKLFWPERNTKKTRALLNLNRSSLRKLIGLLTGHCLLGKHAKYMGLTNDDECRFCNDISSTEDVIHITCECPVLWRKRLRFLNGASLTETQLAFLELKDLKAFLDSLGSIDRVS